MSNVIVTDAEIANNLIASEAAAAAYKFALAHAGIEMDDDAAAEFVSKRNEMAGGFRDLWELKSWCEKTAASIKEICKHAFNVGGELPNNVKWAKESYTYKFKEGAASIVAGDLVDRGFVTLDAVYSTLTPSSLSKAAGLTVQKLSELYPDAIDAEPKERTLQIK